MRILCESYETGPDGQPSLLRCLCLADADRPEDKPRGMIQFVPACAAVPLEVRLKITFSVP